MSDSYELNEKDIDSVIRFLNIHDPEHATPEMAIALLEHLHATLHTLAKDNPELLEELYEDFKKKKSN